MNWRPGGYYPRATKLLNQYRNDEIDWASLIEGLEDAMLEALKEKGVYGKPSGDCECFCLDPLEPEPEHPGAIDDKKWEEWNKWRDKRKYPDDIEGIDEMETCWLIAIPGK